MQTERTRLSWCKGPITILGGLALGILAAFILIMAVGLVFTGPKTYLWLLPDGYAGWVRVDFGVPTAPTLPREDGYRVLRVPNSGVIQTSEQPLDAARGRPQFWFELSGVRRSASAPIAGFTTQTATAGKMGEPSVSSFSFFGSDKQFEAIGRQRDSKRDPKPGWIGHDG